MLGESSFSQKSCVVDITKHTLPLEKGEDKDGGMICPGEATEGFGKESEAFGDAFLKNTSFHTRPLITNG